MKLKKLFGILWVMIGLSLGGGLAVLALNGMTRLQMVDTIPSGVSASVVLIGIAIGGVIGYLTVNGAFGWLEAAMRWLQSRPLVDLIAGGAGLIVGLLIAFLLTQLVEMIRYAWLALLISVLMYIVLGYMGVMLGLNHREGWRAVIPNHFRSRGQESSPEDAPADGPAPKVLDTSVLVDGRIEPILGTGFLEGEMIIPAFVLTELQHLADSADEGRRARGRRGLDTVERLRQQLGAGLRVCDLDHERIADVDGKLVWLSRQVQGKLVTNDYNLNKIAAVQSVPVLNINDLANAVKSAALPGDRMMVKLMKEGKEPSQGVGYLADGTMVVVEDGAAHIGQEVEVAVTSSLQTSAGRMIFAKMEN